MTKNTQVYSVEYTSYGKPYSMQILGTLEEAHNHADNLGLSEPELVVANVPVLQDGFH